MNATMCHCGYHLQFESAFAVRLMIRWVRGNSEWRDEKIRIVQILRSSLLKSFSFSSALHHQSACFYHSNLKLGQLVSCWYGWALAVSSSSAVAARSSLMTHPAVSPGPFCVAIYCSFSGSPESSSCSANSISATRMGPQSDSALCIWAAVGMTDPPWLVSWTKNRDWVCRAHRSPVQSCDAKIGGQENKSKGQFPICLTIGLPQMRRTKDRSEQIVHTNSGHGISLRNK